MSASETLLVDFVGEVTPLSPGDELEFGRGAALDIDANPYLHRRVGRFYHRDGLWLLANVGRSIHLVLIDAESLSQATIAPGREVALTFLPATLRFRAGRSTYELLLESAGSSPTPWEPHGERSDTVTVSTIPLTPDQRLLIIALAEPTLRAPADGLRIPPSRQAAARLHWAITKFNRKLDNVCAKLENAGVAGLHGAPGALASSRRRQLVEFALQSGLVTMSDLALLDSIDGGSP